MHTSAIHCILEFSWHCLTHSFKKKKKSIHINSNVNASSINVLAVHCCVSGAFTVLFGGWLLLPLQHAPPPPFCVSAKPFVTAVKGPSSEGQSPPEHGLHVLGSDRLCHGYSQQTRTARHPAPSLPWSRGKSLVGTPLLIHPVQLHPVQPWGQARRHPGQITLHATALHNCPYQIST